VERPQAARAARPGRPRRRRPPAPPLLPRGPGRAAEKETEVDGALAPPPKVEVDPARACRPRCCKTNPLQMDPRTETGPPVADPSGPIPASLAANTRQYKRWRSLVSRSSLLLEGGSFSRAHPLPPAPPGGFRTHLALRRPRRPACPTRRQRPRFCERRKGSDFDACSPRARASTASLHHSVRGSPGDQWTQSWLRAGSQRRLAAIHLRG
jgi:hypothetical protein